MPASAEGVTTQNSKDAAVTPFQHPVFLHNFDEVLTACGRVAAIRPKPGTDQQLIAANQRNKCPFAKPFDGRCSRIHHLWFCNLRRARDSSDRSDCWVSSMLVGPLVCDRWVRGMTTKSTPLSASSAIRRNASRISRFQRFRTGAWPTLRETESPSLEKGSSFSQAYTMNRSSATLRRRSNARLKSAPRRMRRVLGNPSSGFAVVSLPRESAMVLVQAIKAVSFAPSVVMRTCCVF